MKLDVNKLSSAVRLALSLGAVAAAGTVTANAQDAQNDQKGQSLDTIVVTGSNIRRVDIETSNPVVTIDRAAITQSGKLTLGDLLQDLPSVVGTTNPQVNNGGGTGSSTIGLRGLGSARTLVLINGERILNNDVNSIPTAMIERVEVLSDGASSVYGSDAIAGVVNFITRNNYQGAEFAADYGISDHDDGQRKGYHFVFGQSSDKGSIMGGVDYNKFDEIKAANRKFGAKALEIAGHPATTSSPLSPIHVYEFGSSNSAPGRITLPTSLRGIFKDAAHPNGCKNVSINPGANGQTVDKNNYHCNSRADAFDYAPFNLVSTPQERTSAFINGNYHLTDNVDVYLNLYHNKTVSNAELAPAIIGTAGGLVIDKNSYYNPFKTEFSIASGLDYRLRNVGGGDRLGLNTSQTDQIHTGFKGNFNLFDQSWNWDLGFGFGHFSNAGGAGNYPNTSALNVDLGPSHYDAASGKVVCDSGAPGCVPFNIFDLNQGDPQAVAAVKATEHTYVDTTHSIERYEHFDFSGGLFNLPAGTVQLAGGLAYRKEYTSSTPDSQDFADPVNFTCGRGSGCTSPLQGGYTVKEAYAEAFIPIVKDLPFVKSLNVTLGDRFSKYSDFGSTNNWKAALEYRPIDDLLLRGTVSKVFRAPTVANVFGAPASSAPGLTHDPCEFSGTGANPNAGNPACQNVPATGPFNNDSIHPIPTQINGVNSGSQYAHLPITAENGKSFDWGFVYDPSYVPGLSVSADLWRVYLRNEITRISAQNVIDLCFSGVQTTVFCPMIRRTGGQNPGQIINILQPIGNLGRLDVSGTDINIKYRLPQFSFGQFSAVLNATYLHTFNNAIPFEGDFHFAGHYNIIAGPAGATTTTPRWKALAALNWNLGPWNASLRTRYIGKFRMGNPNVSQGQGFIGFPDYFIDYGATVYNDISAGYNIEALNTRIDVGVDNVSDKQPPQLYYNTSTTINLGTDPTTFDVVGRYFFGRVTVKF